MPDDDDLPDYDFESIYGRVALDLRRRLRSEAQIALLDTLLAEHDARMAALQQRHDQVKALRNRPHGR